VLLIAVVVGIFVFLVLGFWSAAKRRAQIIQCGNNLKKVGLSFRMWSADHRDNLPMEASVTNGGTMELAEKADAFVHFQALSNVDLQSVSEKFEPKLLVCPADREKAASVFFDANFGNQNLSYFIDLDAKEDGGETNFLAGDRNLTLEGTPVTSGLLKLHSGAAVGWSRNIHREFGNICFADGSVQGSLDATKLQQALQRTGMATNRLAIP
jgi:prepilin-type processing-associated H-X9-DG protein